MADSNEKGICIFGYLISKISLIAKMSTSSKLLFHSGGGGYKINQSYVYGFDKFYYHKHIYRLGISEKASKFD